MKLLQEMTCSKCLKQVWINTKDIFNNIELFDYEIFCEACAEDARDENGAVELINKQSILFIDEPADIPYEIYDNINKSNLNKDCAIHSTPTTPKHM